jgi:hypothetical protein
MTIAEIAIVEFHVGCVMRLTLLAPDIVEAILDGRQPGEITLAALMRRFPVGWREQENAFKLSVLSATSRWHSSA